MSPTGPLHTLSVGTAGPRVAFLHGLFGQGRNWSTIAKALGDAGFELADVVRARYYVTDRDFVDRVYPILGDHFGDIRPAATMLVCGLAEPEMKIEIEVTALLPDGAAGA